MEKIYIVYVEEDIFLVKASNKKEAVNMLYTDWIKPMNSLIKKSDIKTLTPEEVLGNNKIDILN